MARRAFLRLAAVAAGGSLAGAARARHCVFVLMAGGPSQSDMFDFQAGPWTPGWFRPAAAGGLCLPQGLLPQIAAQRDCISFLRGLQAPSTCHPAAQSCLPSFTSVGILGSESVYGFPCAASIPGSFEEACADARTRIREAHTGLRLQITLGGWDSHAEIYETTLDAANPGSLARRFDAGLGALLAGLKEDGLLAETLVVAMGEFGRTPGPLNFQRGRDHYPQHAALVAGGGIRGGQAIDSAGFEFPEIWS